MLKCNYSDVGWLIDGRLVGSPVVPGRKENAMTDVYQEITDKIIAKLEEGTIPWKKPWRGGTEEWPKNLKTKKAYNGINVALLGWCNDFTSPFWATYKQVKSLGGYVKRGSKGTKIVYWNWSVRKVEVEGKDSVEKKFPFLKTYVVFNADQCSGLEKHLPKVEDKDVLDFNPILECEKIVAGFKGKPEIVFDGNGAFYRPINDSIHLPKKETFVSEEEFYSTEFHELIHSTGHKSRLDRKGIAECNSFDSANYSEEELVAEFGAAFLCGVGGVEPAIVDNSAAYIKGWLKRLRNDKKLAVLAAAQGGKAADYILGR